MTTRYKNCPFCQSPKGEHKEIKGIIVVTCLECKNKIDVYPKE